MRLRPSWIGACANAGVCAPNSWSLKMLLMQLQQTHRGRGLPWGRGLRYACKSNVRICYDPSLSVRLMHACFIRVT
jgi:hypothetical protein